MSRNGRERVTRRGAWLRVLGWLGLGSLGIAAAADAQAPPRSASAGMEACRECHPAHTAAVEQSVHGRLRDSEWRRAGHAGCEACHGAALTHAADPKSKPDLPKLQTLAVREKNQVCETCHSGARLTQLANTAHDRDMACVECHDPHRATEPAMLRGPELETCGGCHAEQRARFEFPSHHPVREARMRCSDCHLAHGGTHASLREEEGNALCLRCHAALQGPFLYDHPPAVEDCKICHDPHGSVTNNLLVQSEPFLCMQCHGAHENFARPAAELAEWRPAFLTKCTQCHPTIHGSDFVGEAGKGRFVR